MIGVKFTRAMRPYGAGDTALLPDKIANSLIGEGAVTRHQFPAAPHAAAGLAEQMPAAAQSRPDERRQTYRTKDARR